MGVLGVGVVSICKLDGQLCIDYISNLLSKCQDINVVCQADVQHLAVCAIVTQQLPVRADATFLVEEVPHEDASRYGVLDTNEYGEVVEEPDDPPSNLVMTGFYTFTPTIFHACHLVQPSDRGEYELPDAIRLDGWRIDAAHPEDRDRAAERLDEETAADTDEAVVDSQS